ncbi:HNH endonuclease signature motif containing protein [Sphingopyxis sp. JAI128]|uniref:HNH endonuclease signature motif containing protein n=1 Tax=Sphingopyxis sp. JAI128 TaxID=2723066 RepID=UPI0016182331|nr:HNH endonuclease signature motif containing protein [Sphingopyxis sp. JAI128]MBB6424998.1 hypothetical protein [Sphingopyxis sp. JAI128]
MTDHGNIPVDMLRQLLRYEPETGKLYWIERPPELFKSDSHAKGWNSRFAGQQAFTQSASGGYRAGAIWGRKYLAHRVIWAVHHGHWPLQTIDHINGVRFDNRITNLRDVPHRENMRNLSLSPANSSGFAGVMQSKRDGRWFAYIYVNGKRIHLGMYGSRDEAVAARLSANSQYGFRTARGSSI